MKKRLLFLAAALFLTAVLWFPEKAPAEAEQKPAQWTVMFYMCGSDLESKYSYATENLKEISSCFFPRNELTGYLQESGDLSGKISFPDPGKVNVLIETGGCREWHAQELGMDISTSALQRWRYEGYLNDDIPDGFYLEETLPLQSMTAPETLADFIRWGAEKYPAEKYALVLWDHGGGSKTGLFIDELFDKKVMNLKDLGQALKNSSVHLEAVLFDACMMANLETAYAISESASWMIASEEVVAGQGTAIGDWLQQLYIDPEFDGEWLGRWICDMTQIKMSGVDNDQAQQLMTWSVIDLSRLPGLTRLFDLTMKRLGEIYVQYPRLLSIYAKYVVNTEHYGSINDNMWDLAGIFYMPELSMNMGVEVHRKMLNALKETVVYCLRGPGRSSARGLSFCYAVNFSKKELDAYAQNCPSPHYLAILDAITPWTAPDWVYETADHLPELKDMKEYQVSTKKVVLDDGLPAVSFEKGSEIGASSVRFSLFRIDEDNGEVISLGTMPAYYSETAGEAGVFRTVHPFLWPALEGQHISSYIIGLMRPGAQEYMGSIPIRVGTETLFLRYSYSVEKNEYTVHGFWDGYETDSGLSNRNLRSLSQMAGREYSLLYPVYTSDYETPDYFHTAAPKTLYRYMQIQDLALPAGTYYLQYVVYDMFMRPMPMDRIEIQWDGTEAKLTDPSAWEGETVLSIADEYWEQR